MFAAVGFLVISIMKRSAAKKLVKIAHSRLADRCEETSPHFDCCRSSDVAGSTPALVAQPAVELFPERRPGFVPCDSDCPGAVGPHLVERR
jgi:hypothetical protein